MSSKKRILIFIDWYLPAYKAGGPVQSVHAMSEALREKFEVYIFTGNTDVDGTVLDVIPDTWTQVADQVHVFYSSRAKRSLKGLRQEIRSVRADAFYINGMFSTWFSVLPLVILRNMRLTNVIIAPRGMLGSGALKIKPFRKWLFLSTLRTLGIYSKASWHVTAESEKADLLLRFPQSNPVYLIPNLPRQIKMREKFIQPEALQLFFFSRISVKKNLLFSLKVLARISDKRIDYHIFGPVEDERYWQSCQAEIKALPENIKVIYEGEVLPADIENKFSSMQVLFLPTLNENYGHAIVEALLCGCPVIISDQTPWKGLQAAGAGFDLPTGDMAKFESAIRFYCDLPSVKFADASESARKYILGMTHEKETINNYLKLFDEQTKN